MKLSVIIPVYNEASTVATVIESVRQCGVPDLEILVVDDCAPDGTSEVLAAMTPAADLRVFRHERNMGKGAGIRTAQENVTGDVVIIQDADLEYSPKEFPGMLRHFEEGRADAVFGSRYSGTCHLVDSFWHYKGTQRLTGFSNFSSNLHLTDTETLPKMTTALASNPKSPRNWRRRRRGFSRCPSRIRQGHTTQERRLAGVTA